jgi:hypothetical protein
MIDSAASTSAPAAGEPDTRTARPSGWRPADVALVVVLLGTVLRVWVWLLDRPLWLDEQMLATNIRDRGFLSMAGDLGDHQVAPVGWLWAQWLVSYAAGYDERTLRFVALLFGIATLVLAWLIGRRWLGAVGTVAFVTLLAVNPALVRYANEVKQYSADAFWVLLMLAVAGWVAESPGSRRRHFTWWAVAGVGALFSTAAILAAPALALILVGYTLRRAGWRAAVTGALGWFGWLAAFAAHYALSLRFALNDPYLVDYWQTFGAYPAAGAGPVGAVRGAVRQVGVRAKDPLHVAPANATIWAAVIWLLVGTGILLAARRRLVFGLLLAAPIGSAVLLAMLRVAPLAGRLALWLVPVAFLCIAITLQAGTDLAVRRYRTRRAVATAAAAASAGVAVALVLALSGSAAGAGRAPHPTIDDRAAIAFMVAQHRPGDLTLLLLSTPRARQWYAPGPALDPVLAARNVAPGPNCDPADLAERTRGFQRLLVYSGGRYRPYTDANVVAPARLAELGRIVEQRHFGGTDDAGSTIYVVDLTVPPSAEQRVDLGGIAANCLEVG